MVNSKEMVKNFLQRTFFRRKFTKKLEVADMKIEAANREFIPSLREGIKRIRC